MGKPYPSRNVPIDSAEEAEIQRMREASFAAEVPDLVVEILSPSTAAADTTLKKQLYERTGVAEYWIADPNNQRLECYRLSDGAYHLEPQTDPVTTLSGGLSIRLADIW